MASSDHLFFAVSLASLSLVKPSSHASRSSVRSSMSNAKLRLDGRPSDEMNSSLNVWTTVTPTMFVLLGSYTGRRLVNTRDAVRTRSKSYEISAAFADRNMESLLKSSSRAGTHSSQFENRESLLYSLKIALVISERTSEIFPGSLLQRLERPNTTFVSDGPTLAGRSAASRSDAEVWRIVGEPASTRRLAARMPAGPSSQTTAMSSA